MARQGNPEHLLGCMLHWAEGSKARNRVVFTNSDPEMLRTFLRFLRGPCEVSDERVGLSINCHLNNGLSFAAIEAWWLAQLGLPASALRAATVNRPSSASRWGRNVLVYGPAVVRALHVPDAEHLRRHPGVPRHRPPGMAGSVRWAVWDSNPEPRD